MSPDVIGVDQRGYIYVFDAGVMEIAKFNTLGAFEAIVAKKGEGPGELRYASSPYVTDSSIAFWDATRSRISELSLDGKPIRTLPVRLRKNKGSTVFGIPGSQEFVAVTVDLPPVRARVEQPAGLWRYDEVSPSGTLGDSLYAAAVAMPFLRIDDGRTYVRSFAPDESPLILMDSSRTRIIAVNRPTPTSAVRPTIEVKVIQNGRSHTKRVVLPGSAIPLSATEKDSLQAETVAAASFAGLQRSAKDKREILAAVQWPDFKEPVTAAAAGPQGTLWLKLNLADVEASAGSGTWLIIDTEFTPIGKAVIPGDSRVLNFYRGYGFTRLTDGDGSVSVLRLGKWPESRVGTN